MSSFVKLSEATASNSGSVSLTGITSNFNSCILFYSDVVPATDGADLQFRLVESGGVNSNSNYTYGIAYCRSDRAFISASGDQLAAAGRDKFPLSGSADNSSTSGQAGKISIHTASNSSENTHVVISNSYLSSGGTQIDIGQFLGGVLKEQTAVTGVSIFFDTGNISKGNFVLFGIKE
tara:strand:- start:194 stop:727 length:534 start_codon:yes stop_codon:yes gene_type:complete